jgi:hypothetical protein
VQATMPSARAVRITVIDAWGRESLRIDDRASGSTYRRVVAIGALPNGSYFLRVIAGDRQWETSFVVRR